MGFIKGLISIIECVFDHFSLNFIILIKIEQIYLKISIISEKIITEI